MNSNAVTFEIPESRLRPLVAELRESIKTDCGTDYSDKAIRDSVVEWLSLRLDTLFEDAVERLTSPTYEDARDFARLLDDAQPAEKASVAVAAAGLNIFNGNRIFSPDKMAAVVSYFATNASNLYKTKLNKLLFYADFIHYYTYGTSISGSRYVHLPYGPVPDGYEDTLEALQHYGVVDISEKNSSELILSGENSAVDFLTPEEQKTVAWVTKAYGDLSASQLTEISHRERAYKNTRAGEEIAYEYAKFFEKLPLKST
ncbi:MAG TPA: Panacea domain-containing protein [Pyrinomonadaceae bacterium]|nr:Panacea domain-containing protein [Pyrinomonadaceae bacterium]